MRKGGIKQKQIGHLINQIENNRKGKKKMTTKKAIAVILVCVLIIALCSCGSSDKKIIGKWYSASGKDSLTIMKDGSGYLQTSWGGTERISWSISGSTLYITDSENSTSQYGIEWQGNNILILDDGNYDTFLYREGT